ncbi:alpha-protein kinase 2 [Gouania willdenowi]|uniref:alpha-protein kinase 2 n=1 Tax=Gouania willdenowi TaxID=441366 RepID=UPI001055A67C|nr:alpha-protein kinase 2 [Gouania willdenowi]XP_028318474.1 alpha-protein kinase 2 [Gouania willdenowi]
MSELYIFEGVTEDFILSPSVDPQEVESLHHKHGGKTAIHDCGPHGLMCNADTEAPCHHSFDKRPDAEIDESWIRPHAPDAKNEILVNDVIKVKSEVSKVRRSDSPIEHWLDACQYLTDEDTGGMEGIQGGFPFISDFFDPPRETQVSDCNSDWSEGSGWFANDTGCWQPRVERWSSVDSWASALSDWSEILQAPPEDFSAAFAEIGAEIDALTLGLEKVNVPKEEKHIPVMGVQDQPLLVQNIPQSPIHSSQSCLYLCMEAPGPELQNEASQGIENTCGSTQDEDELEESNSSLFTTTQPLSDSLAGAVVASPGEPGANTPAVTSMLRTTASKDMDLSFCGGEIHSLETESFNTSEDPVFLKIIEDTDLDFHQEQVTKKPSRDELCEVTDEHWIFQADGSRTPSEDHKFSTDPVFLTPQTAAYSHAPGVDTRPEKPFNVNTHLPFDSSPDFKAACQLGPQSGSPKFIITIAPLGVGPTLVCQASRSLETDQTFSKRNPGCFRGIGCERVHQSAAFSTSDGITSKAALENDEELIHKREKTRHTAERSSLEEQQDTECYLFGKQTTTKKIQDVQNLTDVCTDHLFIPHRNHVACVTLNLNDPFASGVAKPIPIAVETNKPELKTAEKMPHKTHKDNKSRSKKDKPTEFHHGAQTTKKQENLSQHVLAQQVSQPATQESHVAILPTGLETKEVNLVIDTKLASEKSTTKHHGKKKKKHAQGTVSGSSVGEATLPLTEVENGAKPKTAKARIDIFEAKLSPKPQSDCSKAGSLDKKCQKPEVKASQTSKPPKPMDHKERLPKTSISPLNDDVIKRRRLSEDRFGKIISALETKLPKSDVSPKSKGEQINADAGAACRKSYSEVVKQKALSKEDFRVVQPIQAAPVSGDPQSLCLWCQFAAVLSDYTVTWTREDKVLTEIKRSAGDESRVSFIISNASHKDLGKYQCCLSTVHGSLSVDYLLTYEVLSEIVIPPSVAITSALPVEVSREEEDVHFSKLIFNEDFLSDRYFGENELVSIITEKVHFGEGMHRKAFRTKLHGGQIPLLVPGHPCVLKVHNAISYGTKNNDELIQKNFTLAVEECHVQNTARQYIQAYTAAAHSVEAFGDVPEIIPIYLIHRPSNDIPYATLEEELIGDFVKYSVKDGKEINLLRRDSEAGQKCCAFQHWVYQKTEGNLLVTDMQGVGMRLTDVGIATCRKGYKGFKGNCATSFIDQFKALHQCNIYCELLELKSLQPKAKKVTAATKPKPQPSATPKKKTFGSMVKGKS